MLSIQIQIDDSEKLIEVRLSGDLDDENEAKSALEQLVGEVDTHKWYSLLLDITALDLPGMKAMSILGKVDQKKVTQAKDNLKKAAIVDNGKVSDLMRAFLIRPPQNLFFDNVESARKFLNNGQE
jgi:hypothetical protein